MGRGRSPLTFTQHFDHCGHLLFGNLFVLLLFGRRFQSLPRQRSPVEVHQDVAQRLHVVASALLNACIHVSGGRKRESGAVLTQMCINGCVSGGPGQVLVLPVRNVLPGFRVPVLFRQPEIDQEKLITVAADPHQEVVRFDI